MQGADVLERKADIRGVEVGVVGDCGGEEGEVGEARSAGRIAVKFAAWRMWRMGGQEDGNVEGCCGHSFWLAGGCESCFGIAAWET